MEPAPPPQRVAGTRSSYNLTHPSFHSPFRPPPTSSSGPHLQSVTPSEDLIQRQCFDPPALPTTLSPPSFTDFSSPSFPHSPICIDSESDKEDNDMGMKAALPEEFSGETRDAVTIFLLHPCILLFSSFSIHYTWCTTHIITTYLFLVIGSHSALLRSL